MQTFIKTHSQSLDFKFLPSFARFILDNYLDEYVKEQLRLSREVDLPLLKYFSSLGDEELINMSKKTNVETLRLISQNKIKEQIQTANHNWVNNQIPLLSRDQITADDISKASYMRRQCFLKFIPAFTEDQKEIEFKSPLNPGGLGNHLCWVLGVGYWVLGTGYDAQRSG